ncbi:MAG TPA: PepSY domain-containing protein [Xanthobacteraceae bacterium]|nr:PepSY domain-containing protein [Xanthobacteraceae bacterium]
MRSAFATAALLALMLASSPAPAQMGYYVSSADAQAIAAQNGVAVIYRLRLDDGLWKIEGRDINGQQIFMRIDPRTGDIVRFERGWF